ncbi:hypothetical protein IE077_002461 [Cardiosporidium cionae]|uniref:Uncharacterized protein n=1 Tax=Cardiosporidium cionae TaxID=476202 RepID=A0ABQ7JAX1_9APIC|nr:hypothetical protein IE077_002461 [Cardiosporidium cionae]|eukprot:KAF8821100.1 hypothetical protein IE077_002461 [Cardiosporidium cionae]
MSGLEEVPYIPSPQHLSFSEKSKKRSRSYRRRFQHSPAMLLSMEKANSIFTDSFYSSFRKCGSPVPAILQSTFNLNERRKEARASQLSIDPSSLLNTTGSRVSISPTTFSWFYKSAKLEQLQNRNIFGLLYGTMNQSTGDIRVEAVLELPAYLRDKAFQTSLFLDEKLTHSHFLAHLLNLQIVGWVYSTAIQSNSSLPLREPIKSEQSSLPVFQKSRVSDDSKSSNSTVFPYIPHFGAREIVQTCALQAQCEKMYNRSVSNFPIVAVSFSFGTGNDVWCIPFLNTDDLYGIHFFHARRVVFVSYHFEAFQVNPYGYALFLKDVFLDVPLQPSYNQLFGTLEPTNLSLHQQNKKTKRRTHRIDKMHPSPLSEISAQNSLRLSKTVYLENHPSRSIPSFMFTVNAPLFTHNSWLHCKFPPVSSSQLTKDHDMLAAYKRIFSASSEETFNSSVQILKNMRDFNLLLFLTNFLSVGKDLPKVCKAIGDLNNTTPIPPDIVSLLKAIATSTNDSFTA